MILYDVWLILYSYTIEYIGSDHHPLGVFVQQASAVFDGMG